MATRKTTAEKLEETQKKKEEYEAREKKYKKMLKAEQRKKETHIKCVLGGAVLKVLKEAFDEYEFQETDGENVIAFLEGQENRGKYFSKAFADYRSKLDTLSQNKIENMS